MTKPEAETYFDYQKVREWIKETHGVDISDYANRYSSQYDPLAEHLSFVDVVVDSLSDEAHNGIVVTIDHTWERDERETHENGDGRPWVLHCLRLLKDEFGTPHAENPDGWFVDLMVWW